MQVKINCGSNGMFRPSWLKLLLFVWGVINYWLVKDLNDVVNLVCVLNDQVELQFHGSGAARENDAIFNYRRKYLPTQQVQ